eukprot:GFUD01014372.1.p1 GENE.GFUD01014372.1~~GFUD01014372.1.p1  ORF type:complete len:232 (+),score=37.99 GFUD01014372.1:160-855(+)
MGSFHLSVCILVMSAATVTQAGSRSYGNSCGSCGGGNSGSYNNGKNIGSAVSGLIGNKLQHIAGFFDGLSGGGNSGCGGCTSSCGSPGCGSSYVPAHNPCSGGCYSNCGSSGCGSSGGSGSTTVIVVKPAQTISSGCGSHGCGSSSSSSYNSASSYPNCQCDYLFNSAGQGNCNIGASSHTSDRWCYVSTDVNGKWVEPQWACPDSVQSDVHHGRYWSRVACDTPKHGHGK